MSILRNGHVALSNLRVKSPKASSRHKANRMIAGARASLVKCRQGLICLHFCGSQYDDIGMS